MSENRIVFQHFFFINKYSTLLLNNGLKKKIYIYNGYTAVTLFSTLLALGAHFEIIPVDPRRSSDSRVGQTDTANINCVLMPFSLEFSEINTIN